MKSRIESLEQYKSRVSESFFSNMSVGEYQSVKNWLDEVGIEKYTINKDLAVDVDDSVELDGMTFEKIPVQFGKVKGYFSVSHCKNLKTLNGCPREVGDSFYCNGCQKLKSLKGCPEEVYRWFNCRNCGKQFTEAEVRTLCNVKGNIVV